MINICICDDDKRQLKRNKNNVREISRKYKQEVEVYTFSSGQVLLDTEKVRFHIALLDIDIPEMNGMEIASQLKIKYSEILIVFLTGYRDYALDAYEIEAKGYLVKPIQIDRLDKTLKNIFDYIDLTKSKEQKLYLMFIDDRVQKKILQETIFYIEKIKNVSKIYASEGVYSVYESLKPLHEKLHANFLQINQGVVVNLSYIKKIEKNEVYLKNGVIFTLGRKNAKYVKQKFFN